MKTAALVLMTLVIGVIGAEIYTFTPLPLPWFMGPMLACLVAIAFRAPVRRAPALTTLGRVLLGLAIGSAFTPDMADRASGMLTSLAFVFPYVVFLGLIGYPYFRMFRDYDRTTAFLAAVPGGFQSMVAIGEDARADLRRLSIIHGTRIMVIVFAVPLWIQFAGIDGAVPIIPASAKLSAITLKEALILVACGAGGYYAGIKLGISGAAIIGPMLANGIVHFLGFAHARVPVEFVNAAQVMIGVHIGCQFAGITSRELITTVSVAFGYALVLLVGAAAFTVIVAWVAGIDPNAVALAFAPGGQPEMNLIALVMDIDPAYVALHHLLRVMIIVFGAQFVLAWLRKMDKGQTAVAKPDNKSET